MQGPYLLVALPQLQDETFSNSVILVGRHNHEGAFGVILNNPLFADEERNLAEMVAELQDASGRTLLQYREKLFEGGPVDEEKVFVLHNVEELSDPESAIGQGLHFGADAGQFHKLLDKEEYRGRRRFYLGYSSWEAGQLDSEIRAGCWLPLPLKSELLFEAAPEGKESEWHMEFWKKILLSSGVNPLTLMGQAGAEQRDAGLN